VPYSLAICWRERQRFLPALLAVTFSAVLVLMQGGLLAGFLAVTSRPIDRSRADIWVGSRHITTLGLSDPIPEDWQVRLAAQPEVVSVEPYRFGWGIWHKPGGGVEQCYVIGFRLEGDSLGALPDLTPELRRRLEQPGAVAVYAADLSLLGLDRGVGEVGEVGGTRARVVGVLAEDTKGAGLMPGLFCSLGTARRFTAPAGGEDQTTYLLARCRDRDSVPAVVRRLRREYPDMTVMTRDDFSRRTQFYWMTKTKAGLALSFSALLGLAVGAVITSQTLAAATVTSLPQYAVLRALGIPRRRLTRLVLAQSFWVAVSGIAVAGPVVFGLNRLATGVGIDILLPVWLLALAAVLTLGVALLSGWAVLPVLRRAEPATLLR
jgi:putative ABC transport system permease protein